MDGHDYWVVDAFSDRPLCGNPAALVFDSDDLDADQMQAIAREMNLSETAFICRPTDADCHYRARFFTPRSELQFGGHPTVAAAFAWHQLHGDLLHEDIVRQQCGIGAIEVTIGTHQQGGHSYFVTLPAPTFQPVAADRGAIARCLGVRDDDINAAPTETVSTGVPWLIVSIVSPDLISALRPDMSLIEDLCRKERAAGVTVFSIGAPGEKVRVRTFAPGEGVSEDPACGSGNGAVAAYVRRHNCLIGEHIQYEVAQGHEIGRPSDIHVSIMANPAGDTIRIGGRAVRVASGHLDV